MTDDKDTSGGATGETGPRSDPPKPDAAAARAAATAGPGATGTTAGPDPAPQPAKPPETPEPKPAPPTTAASSDAGGKETDIEALENAKRENRRSAVRVAVTYIAAGFLFLVGAAVVGYLLAIGDIATGKDIFLTILPVAAAIVTYWYAGRKGDESAVKIIKAMQKRD